MRMETRTDKELLMEYLYDELSTEERDAFEVRLAGDAGLRKELSDLRNIRLQIELDDEEVVDPFVFSSGGSNSVWLTSRIIGNAVLKPLIGLAAGICLIITLGYLTKAHVSTQDGYLSISFGKTEQPLPAEEFITKAQFEKLVSEFDRSKKNADVQLARLSESMDTRLAGFSESSREDKEVNVKPLSELALQLQKDNLQFLERYMAQSTVNQERMIENMLVDFSDFLREQRQEDLRNIQYSLKTLKENQELTELETNQVLASILTKVNTQNN
jgi:hypothetical protein